MRLSRRTLKASGSSRHGRGNRARRPADLSDRRLADELGPGRRRHAPVHPELVSLRRLRPGLEPGLQARTFLNSVIFVVFAVGIQWALCISAPGDHEDALPRAHRDHGDVAVSLFIPVVTTVIPVFVVTNQFGLINTYRA